MDTSLQYKQKSEQQSKQQSISQQAEKMQVDLIVAHSWPEMGIGKSGELPWNIRADLINFRKITSNSPSNQINAVIMGRKTWESLPVSVRPLPGRLNIIISSIIPETSSGDLVEFTTLENLPSVFAKYQIHRKFIIGGGQLYEWAMKNCDIGTMYVTEVFQNEKKDLTKYDTFFPDYLSNAQSAAWPLNDSLMIPVEVSPIKQSYETSNHQNKHSNEDYQQSISSQSSTIYYRFLTYVNSKILTNSNQEIQQKYLNIWTSPEQQYLQLMNKILTDGIDRPDRTGTGTISLFGTRQEYNLAHSFPLSTTKRMFFRAIFEELALYISGRTDNKILQSKDIHIWDGNTSREFLDRRGLSHYPEGDMGETYGFNFRHYGANYQGCDKDYSGHGYDQLANLVELIKNEPTSRRLIINLWNPATQHKAALPACLMMYQFFVDTVAKTLSVQIYLRSSDYFLANNWNACTGALLVHLICNLEGINLVPGKLIVVTGDTHIYKTHLEQVNINLLRQPFLPCQLVVKGEKKKSLTEFKFEDLRLLGYKSHPNILAPMAV